MMQKRKVGFIVALVPFLMATAGFATSANASGHDG
jgi:hypothetical protein